MSLFFALGHVDVNDDILDQDAGSAVGSTTARWSGGDDEMA